MKCKDLKAPLGFGYRFVYLTFTLPFALLGVGVLLLSYSIPQALAYSDPNVIACNSVQASLTAVPFCCIFVLWLFFVVEELCENRRIKPFSKGFTDALKDVVYRKHPKLAIAVFTALALSVLLMLCGICRRTVIDSDYTVIKYGTFNNVIGSESIADADKMTVRAERTESYGRTGYTVSISLAFDGGEYRFYARDFDDFFGIDKDTGEVRILHIKSLFSDGRFFTDGEEFVDKYIKYSDLTEGETAVIYELFQPLA